VRRTFLADLRVTVEAQVARAGKAVLAGDLRAVLGVLVIVALVAHTGLRSGHGLNQLLLLGFALMLLVGAVSSGVTGLRHRVGGSLAQRLQRQSVWLHILLFWPVPALLGWHVFKTYWF
jgi:nitrite reductase (NADH) large subunit